MASNFVSTISSEWTWPDEIWPVLIQTPNRAEEMAGQSPDTDRIYAGCTPDGIQVAYVTPDLTQSVRDGVLLELRS